MKKDSKKSSKRKVYHLDYKEIKKGKSRRDDEDVLEEENEDQNNPSKEYLKQYGYDVESNPFNDPNLDRQFVWKAKKDKLEKEGKKTENLKREDLMMKHLIEIEKVKERREQREREKSEWEQERMKNELDKDGYSFSEWKQKEHEFHLKQSKERSQIRIKLGRPKAIDLLYINISPEFEIDCEIMEPHKIIEGLDLKSLEELVNDLETYSELDKNKNQDYWSALHILSNYEIEKKKKQQKIKHMGDGIHSSVTDDVANIFEDKSIAELEELELQIKERVSDPSTPDPEYWNSLLSNVVIYLSRAKLCEIHKQYSIKRFEKLKEQKEKILSSSSSNQDSNSLNLTIENKRDNSEEASEEDFFFQKRSNKSLQHDKEELEDLQDKVNRGEMDTEEFRKIQLENEAKRLFERSKSLSMKSLKKSSTELLREEKEKGFNQGEEPFNIEVPLVKVYEWSTRYTPIKPQYFNRVKIGFEWTKYNRTHFDSDNPPPKVVKGYRFNIFYPDLANTKIAPTYRVTTESDEWCIIYFSAGAPYQDIAFKIVNREWEYSHKRGYKCLFDRGVFHLFFNFRKYRYRR